MSTTDANRTVPGPGIASRPWRLDPTRSTTEFHIRHGKVTALGDLHAAGRHIPMDVDATLRQVGDESEAEATAVVDHRELGVTRSPLGIPLAPSTLIVRGRLVDEEDV